MKINEVYSKEEFLIRKNEIINNLINDGIVENIDDFLVKIISLKERGILNLEDITQIKSSLSGKAKAENKDVMNEASSENKEEMDVICKYCENTIELNSREIRQKQFICPVCNKYNKIN